MNTDFADMCFPHSESVAAPAGGASPHSPTTCQYNCSHQKRLGLELHVVGQLHF